MPVGSLSERFALIITADPEDAVRGLKRVGDTADKELGKTQDHLSRLGGRMQVAGAGMIAFGAVALVGLGHFAEKANEAEKAELKLQNSIANSPRMAGESSAAFDDLANKLQKTTVFDHEATQSMEAYLIQVGLAKDQVLGLTPAIQDLAAKGDIPLDDAAKKVVLALNGKKKGLEALIGPLDATTYSTDRYKAVQDALARSVGGFAGQQGKTFEGQLTILQNQLGELEEGVGKGVVDAFSHMFSGVQTVTGALDTLGSDTQSRIGEFATYGATITIGVGALSMLAGTVLKARDNFSGLASMLGITTAAQEAETASAAEGEVANAGLLATLGPAGMLTAVAVLAVGLVGLASATDNSAGAASSYEEELKNLKGELDQTNDTVTASKLSHNDAAKAANDAGLSYAQLGDAVRNGTDDFGAYDRAAAHWVQTVQGGESSRKNFIDDLKAAGAEATPFGRSLIALAESGNLDATTFHNLTGEVEGLHNDLEDGRAKIDAFKQSLLGTGGGADDAKVKLAALQQELKDLHDEIHAEMDPLFGMQKAITENATAQATATGAAMAHQQALQELDDATRKYGASSDQANEAAAKVLDTEGKLTDANMNAASSAMSVNDAAQTLSQSLAAGDTSAEGMKNQLAAWVQQGLLTADQAQQVADKLGIVIGQANALDGRTINLGVKIGTTYVGNNPGASQMVKVGASAAGQTNWRGGLSWVGEDGPELVDIPRGSNVYPTDVSARMASGHSVVENHFHIGSVIGEERAVLDVLEKAANSGFRPGPGLMRMLGNGN